MFESIDENVWDERHLPQNKEKIVVNYIRLVEINAAKIKRTMPKFVEMEELKSMGMMGLLDAITKFDLERGLKFETFASTRIRGSILDGLRKQDWVPRTTRTKQKKIQEIVSKLEETLMRAPTHKEIAEELGINPREVNRILYFTEVGNILKLDTGIKTVENEESISFIDTIGQNNYDDGSMLDFQEMSDSVAHIIDNLPEKQKNVIKLYYAYGMNLAEVSNYLNLTQSRVSQLYTKAIKKIYQELTL